MGVDFWSVCFMVMESGWVWPSFSLISYQVYTFLCDLVTVQTLFLPVI